MMAAFHHRLASTLLAMLFISHTANGKPGGPPVSTCSSMSPNHGTSRSAKLTYAFELSQECYTAGQRLTVTLNSTEDVINFQGFFVQARASVDDAASHGTFILPDATHVQLIDCFGAQNNAVGHKSEADKSSISFMWTPPTGASGNYTFVGTVVQTYDTFWVKAVTYTVALCPETTPDMSNTTMSSVNGSSVDNTSNTTMTSTSAPSTTISSTTQDSSAAAVSAVESLVVLCIAALLGITVVRAGGF